MKKRTVKLASILIPLAAGALSGCDEVADGGGLCGPCGVVVEGDVGISGNAKLDGFFAAVADLNKASVAINGDFEANLDELMAVFGVTGTGMLQADVDALVGAIRAEIMANTSGGLVVNFAPPSCQANVNVAVEAQAQCEAKADCMAMVDPGEVSVMCEGKCEGSCSGTCSGGFSCDLSAGGTCSGMCQGACELNAAASCDGTCRGSCTGECSAYNGAGECAGACDGECMGTCEFAAEGSCDGTCTGSCEVMAEAECQGMPVTCSGSCDAQCSGGCKGSATPPSASASCEASADCQAQAKAQASANVECTPPSLEFGFEFTGMASAEAEFVAKMGALKARGVAMLQGFTKYQALFTGMVNGEVVFQTAPVLVVQGQLQGLVQAGATGNLFADIPPGRIDCVIPAMQESINLLGALVSESSTNLSAQSNFATALTGGFST